MSVQKTYGARNGLTASWSRRKVLTFGLFFMVISTVIALVAAEYVLRILDERISHSESMQPGLIRYDATLGWALSPGWSGRHHHHDFDVGYAIDRRGFRADPAMQGDRPQVAVLGDSFTFGLGVEDAETFVSRLNAGSQRGAFLNMGVPGYSTDQELLLLRRTFDLEQVDTVMLVVYLANDLFDNTLPFPLQADHGKPFYSLEQGGRLLLHNRPVPTTAKPAAARSADLSSLVLGGERPATSLLERTLGQTHIARRLGLFQSQATLSAGVLQRRFEPYIDLFIALTAELQRQVTGRGARLVVALLPGASYVERPASLSAQYQQYLREQLLQRLAGMADVAVIDLAAALRQAASEQGEPFYFPNEHHLNAQGHQFVSRVIAGSLADVGARHALPLPAR